MALLISPMTEQERKWAEADRLRHERLNKPCLYCVWARIEGDKIFCPIVIDCWKNGIPTSKEGEQTDVDDTTECETAADEQAYEPGVD